MFGKLFQSDKPQKKVVKQEESGKIETVSDILAKAATAKPTTSGQDAPLVKLVTPRREFNPDQTIDLTAFDIEESPPPPNVEVNCWPLRKETLKSGDLFRIVRPFDPERDGSLTEWENTVCLRKLEGLGFRDIKFFTNKAGKRGCLAYDPCGNMHELFYVYPPPEK